MANEEYDEQQPPVYEDEDESEGGMFRWMSTLVVLFAVAGFFGLAWYAYRNGGETVDEKDVDLIKADKTPVKEAPANPGGMQIPNQDKTVYGLISGKTEKPVVERILPAPEEPMQRGGDTETWMNGHLKNGAQESGEAVTAADADTQPADSAAPKEPFRPKAHASSSPSAVAAPVTQVTVSVAPAAPAPTPPPANAPVVAAKPAPTPASAAPTPAPDKKPAAAAAAADASDDDDDDKADDKAESKKSAPPPPAAAPAGPRAQLGAYKSPGEAETNWNRIAHKFAGDVQGKQHYIVRADLGAKGVYYRLQVGPFASSGAAEEFCLDFVSAGQVCIVAKGK